MKRLLLLALPLVLAACTIHQSYPARQSATVESSPQVASDAPASSVQTSSLTLVDQSYVAVTGTGADWLRAIKTQLLTGNVSTATLHLHVARGDSKTGWAAVGLYIATATKSDNGNTYPDSTKFGNHLHFVSAVWNGSCKRQLSPSSSFGVLKSHDADLTIDLAAVPVAKGDDGCSTDSETLNLLDVINNGGLFLGVSPSSNAYSVTATVEYTGNLSAQPF